MNTNPLAFLDGYKTYLSSAAGVLTGIVMLINGDTGAGALLVFTSLHAMFLRRAVNQATTTVVVNQTPDEPQALARRGGNNLPSVLLLAGLGCAALGLTPVPCHAQAQPVSQTSLTRPACFNLGIANGNGGNAALLAAINAMVQGQQQLLQGQQQIIQLLIAMQHQPVPTPIVAPPVGVPIAQASPPTINLIQLPRQTDPQPPLYTLPPIGGTPQYALPQIGAAPLQTLPPIGGAPLYALPGAGSAPLYVLPGAGGQPIYALPPAGGAAPYVLPGIGGTPVQPAPPVVQPSPQPQPQPQLLPPPKAAPFVLPPAGGAPITPQPPTPSGATGYQSYTHASAPAWRPVYDVDYSKKQ